MNTTDGINGFSRFGNNALVGALGKLSKNPLLNSRSMPSPFPTEGTIPGDHLAVSVRRKNPSPIPKEIEEKEAGAFSVFVRTGILQNPKIALDAQATIFRDSLLRLLD
jgi:hypothetical protein